MPRNRLVIGDWNAICDICGLKFKGSELRKNWKHQRVCEKDYETRNAQDFIQGVPDSQKVPFTRPDTTSATAVYLSVTYNYGNGNNENTKPTPTFNIVD